VLHCEETNSVFFFSNFRNARIKRAKKISLFAFHADLFVINAYIVTWCMHLRWDDEKTNQRSVSGARWRVRQQFLIASCFVLRSGASIDLDRVFLFRFVVRYRVRRGSTRKSCFSRLRGTRGKTRCEISNNRCSLDAIDEWIHRTAHSARPGSISLFPDFRFFFSSPQRYFVTPIVHWGTLQVGTRVLFPLKYWNIRIIRYVDPIWSKMKKRLWFTVCRHWFRYLCVCW